MKNYKSNKMTSLILVGLLTLSCSSESKNFQTRKLASENEETSYKLFDDTAGKMNVIVEKKQNETRFIIELPTFFMINRSKSLPAGKYFLSSLNKMSVNDNSEIIVSDNNDKEAVVGKFKKDSVDLCSGGFDSVCTIRFTKGTLNMYYIELN